MSSAIGWSDDADMQNQAAEQIRLMEEKSHYVKGKAKPTMQQFARTSPMLNAQTTKPNVMKMECIHVKTANGASLKNVRIIIHVIQKRLIAVNARMTLIDAHHPLLHNCKNV